MILSFFVPGVPQPGGSKKGFAVQNKTTGKYRAVIVDDAKEGKPWRAVVSLAAKAAMASECYTAPFAAPLEVEMIFRMPRPKGHYRTGKNAHLLRDHAPAVPDIKPDVLKLARSTEDAMTGIVWRDDCQTVRLMLRKEYADEEQGPGVLIWVERI